MADQWNEEDGHRNDEDEHWNEEDYSSYAFQHEIPLPATTGSPMERRVSNESYWSQHSLGDFSWPASTPPDAFPDVNEDFLFSPESSPIPDRNYSHFPEPQGSSSVQPLDYAEGYQVLDAEAAARHATDSAAYLLYQYRHYQYPELQAAFITSDAIEAIMEQELSHAEFPTREAIHTLLCRFLYEGSEGTLVPDTDTLLLEAAYQLQLRTEGPPEEVAAICYTALVVTLMQLGGGPAPDSLPSTQPEASTKRRTHKKTPKAKAEKKRYTCYLDECSDEPKPFSRAADLDRHQKLVHLGGKKFPCDYGWCPRHKEQQPFSRQDHYRDHLRNAHFEDLPIRGPGKMDEGWWAGRSRFSVAGDWWRCNKCLVMRVSIGRDDFVCPGCGNHCEGDRIEYRRLLEEGLQTGGSG
ncbi:hypothetical protein B0T18DRAFT_170929 [Schizothecium vesticola]|uniref:C2H2-type domain-containing protein n=1 Tax=Schizothecium vesticola TaxID=314040 RepID=A0AA40K1T6_9PEZI|nr:hypothetical protein B0T18DRAFT_170929 [Schizothecium vesticola]